MTFIYKFDKNLINTYSNLIYQNDESRKLLPVLYG